MHFSFLLNIISELLHVWAKYNVFPLDTAKGLGFLIIKLECSPLRTSRILNTFLHRFPLLPREPFWLQRANPPNRSSPSYSWSLLVSRASAPTIVESCTAEFSLFNSVTAKAMQAFRIKSSQVRSICLPSPLPHTLLAKISPA